MNTNEQLRKALAEIAELIIGWRVASKIRGEQYQPLRYICDTALSAPLRNCDVGTDSEQANRLRNICIKYRAMKGKCLNCHIFKAGDSPCDCFARWSQMPYEDEQK